MDVNLKKGNLTAKVELKDPNKIIRVKPMQYTPEDRVEFGKQIKELLEMKVIIPSKSPHSSPAFLVEEGMLRKEEDGS